MDTKQHETVTTPFNKDITLTHATYVALQAFKNELSTHQATGHPATPSDAVQHLLDMAYGDV